MFTTKARNRVVAATVSTVAASGLVMAAAQPAAAQVNTLMLCVSSAAPAQIQIQPSNGRTGILSTLVSNNRCWSAYFDTKGTRQVDILRNGKHIGSDTWNSNNGAKAIYL
ncbi:hypothetical protein Kisp01_71740 [Kineosporia sp. NBRC 101677]|uniref:hypothetical protein n=1 Tax=Kineosporia sp. NBRC 101677 TaxID=3032197 RepID=UPI0024A206FE|nr:hypothetical protein [Kineosporia sp. NBRC 101677]GLY20160.1 hypothetical protein Kisp01_71740 [Kineosporia sp. NBRC 101677]